MTNLTVNQTSLGPNQGDILASTPVDLRTDRRRWDGQDPIGALVHLVGTLAAIVLANVSPTCEE